MLTEAQTTLAFETWLSRGGTLFLERISEPDRKLLFKTWQASALFTQIVDKEGFDAAMEAMPSKI